MKRTPKTRRHESDDIARRVVAGKSNVRKESARAAGASLADPRKEGSATLLLTGPLPTPPFLP
jgi:hypothetical protein